jgi:hypothetical protein
MAKEFRVSHARIELDGLGGAAADPEYFESALAQSWVPGTEVSRYTRTWKLSARTVTEEGLWAGHIGFVKEGELATLEWDDASKDFVRGEASSGVVVPFIINLERQLVSFQLFPGEVRQNTVTGNLQALLSAEGTHFWTVRPVLFRRTIDQWLESVNRVSTFNVLLMYPNPNWTGREKVEGLVDGLRAETLRLKAKAAEDQTIDTGSDWFTQAMDHVRRGYGRADLTGPDKDTGEESHFVETSSGGAVPVVDRVAAEEDALEASVDDLSAAQARLVESHPQDIVVADVDEGLDDDPQG